MNAEIIQEIIMKLVGDIRPTGATHLDNERSENIDVYIELVSNLIGELYIIASDKDDYRASMKEIGDKAFEYLEKEHEFFTEYIEDLEEEK